MWIHLSHFIIALGVSLPSFQPGELELALLDAARNGDTDAVEELLDEGADIEARVESMTDEETSAGEYRLDAGATALVLAATEGHVRTVGLLIKRGADVNARDDADFTALERAAFVGHVGPIELLLENGARVAGDSMALMWGARQGRRGVVRVLIEAGADPNAPTTVGWTPLMFAAESGEADIVADLIAAGADVNAMSLNGYTALRCALERGRQDIVDVLEAAGANPVN